MVGFTRHDSAHPKVVGYEVFAKANSGVANLFSSDKPKAPEGGGDFTIGRHFSYLTRPGPPPIPTDQMVSGKRYVPAYIAPETEKWWLIDAGYSRSSFYVSNTPVAASTANTNFDRYRIIGVLNGSFYGKRIIGIAGGAERRNNLDDLKSVQFQTVIAPAPTGSSNSIVTTKSGYYGDYKIYTAAPVYFDWLEYLPPKITVPGFGNRVALDGFARADVGNANRTAKGGLGIYIFKKDDALTPLGGVTVSYGGSKVSVSLTTGFSLGK